VAKKSEGKRICKASAAVIGWKSTFGTQSQFDIPMVINSIFFLFSMAVVVVIIVSIVFLFSVVVILTERYNK